MGLQHQPDHDVRHAAIRARFIAAAVMASTPPVHNDAAVRDAWQALCLAKASRQAFAELVDLDWSAPVSEIHWWIADWLDDALRVLVAVESMSVLDGLH